MNFSYSKLSSYENCPYKFKKIYIDKIPQKRTWQLCLGISAADIVQQIYTANDLDIETLISQFWIPLQYKDEFKKSATSSHEFLGYKTSVEESEQKILLKAYIEDFLQHYGCEKPFGVEVPFELYFKDTKITGRADMIKKDDSSGFLRIIDEKLTSQFIPDLPNSMQLGIYFIALSDILKRFKITAVGYYYFKFGKEVLIDSKNLNLTQIKDRICSILESIQKEVFDPKVNQYCRACQFKGECPK